MNIKELIEKKMKEQGLTKKSFALAMDVQPQNLNKMLESPSFPSLEKIAKTLDLSLGELFADNTKEQQPQIVCPYCGKPIKINVE